MAGLCARSDETLKRPSFADRVYRLTSRIPKGKVGTYGAIARKLGRPRASRAVGRILGANPHPIVVPCHRVVKSDGRLGGYSAPRGVAMKVELLASEGVIVENGRVDLARFLLKGFSR